MKFECIYNDINKALMSISKVNAKSNVIPIIELIHIEADDNLITFRSTNLEVILEISINAKVEIKGKLVINYMNISKVTNLIKSDILKVELIDNFLFIQSGKSKIKLQVNPYEDIPELPIIDIVKNNTTTIVEENNNEENNNEENKDDNKENKYKDVLDLNNFIIDREAFINTIKSVSFAAANTDIKPEISSVYMYSLDSYLYTVATDTFRLAENRINISNVIYKNKIVNSNTESKISIMIPSKTVAILLPILESLNSEKLDIESYNDGILISINNTFIAVRTINGNFPDYKQLFPKEWLGVISLDKSVLSSNLSATMLFKDNYSYSNFIIKENTLYIKTSNKNIGSYESEIEIKNIPISTNSFELESDYNSTLLLEGITKINGNSICIRFTLSRRPIFIKSESNNDFVYLLMPLNR